MNISLFKMNRAKNEKRSTGAFLLFREIKNEN